MRRYLPIGFLVEMQLFPCGSPGMEKPGCLSLQAGLLRSRLVKLKNPVERKQGL